MSDLILHNNVIISHSEESLRIYAWLSSTWGHQFFLRPLQQQARIIIRVLELMEKYEDVTLRPTISWLWVGGEGICLREFKEDGNPVFWTNSVDIALKDDELFHLWLVDNHPNYALMIEEHQQGARRYILQDLQSHGVAIS